MDLAKGSTTSTDKIVVLENAGIQAFQVVLDSESVQDQYRSY
jgi:hypothetical protein